VSRWWPDHLVLRLGDAPRVQGATTSRWDTTLDAFGRELDARAAKRGTRITCVVSGDGVRYRIVPWSDELTSPAQRRALAQHCFKDAYGDVAGNWSISQTESVYGGASLACALDAILLDRLEAVTRSRGLRLVGLQPSMMNAFNGAHVSVGSGSVWLVCAEPAWTTLLLVSGGEPLHVRQLPSAGFELALALNREWFALGLEGTCPPARIATLGAGPTSAAGDSAEPVWTYADIDASAMARLAA